MRKYCLIFLSVFAAAMAAAPWASAQGMVLPRHFSNWSGQPGPDSVETENYATLWKETGRTPGEFNQYTSGAARINVGLRKYRDPSSAYEMYTALIRPEMHPSTLNRTSAVDGDRLIVLVGSSILQVRPTQAISTADLVTLVNSVSARADQTPLPPIRTYLPDGFSDGTQRYALGPAGLRNALNSLKHEEFTNLVSEAGFTSGAEAMIAEYRNGKDSAGLLLLEYPTPQLAELHLRHLEIALPRSAGEPGAPIERKGSLLAIVLSPSSEQYAKSLRNAVNYETQVTWNEPSATATDPPWTSVIAQIFIGTGVFMVAAVVLGIAFGGVRVVTKIFFPGKVFDRPERMEILQLGLSGKKIDPSDFY